MVRKILGIKTDTVNIMRKSIFNFAVLAAAAGILASCSSYEEIPTVAGVDQAAAQAVDSITVTFTATFEQSEDTRTSLDPVSKKQVKWSTGDEVTVIGKGTYSQKDKGSWKTITSYYSVSGNVTITDKDGYQATISVTLPAKTGTKQNDPEIEYLEYYAVYPAITANSPSDELSISTSLKSEQTATEGTFANNVNISAAKSSNKEFHFENLCALLSFTVDTDIVSATLTSNSQTPMSGGTATISFSGENPSIKVSGIDLSPSVKLTGEMTKGTQYYFVVYPGNHTAGFTLEFEDKDGRVASLSSTKELSLESRSNFNLGSIQIEEGKWDTFAASKQVGIFDLSENIQYAYRPYFDQLVWSVKSSVNSFRIQDIVSRNYLSISGLPASFEKGQSYDVTVYQNYLTSEAETYEDELTVFNESNGYVRLVGKNHKYIIKTK